LPITPPGGGDLPPRRPQRHEPRDRRSAVHQPQHGRVSPPQRVPEAGRQVTHAARPRIVL